MVDSRREQPVANEHFKAYGYTVPEEILALVASGEMKDLSWHNDAAPSYGVVLLEDVTVALWVDHVDLKAREVFDKRFFVSVYNHEAEGLQPKNDGQVMGTDDVDEAIKAWRETLAELKRQIDNRPKRCEACDIPLNPDLTCPHCGVSHAGEKCATCGRFGLHKDDCTEPPGMHTEGGPVYLKKRALAVATLWTMADRERRVGWLGHVYNAVCPLGFTMAEVDDMLKSHDFRAN